MPRVLAALDLTVAPDRREEYLRLAAEQAAAMRAGQGHLWVFRHQDDPTRFFEFREWDGAGDNPLAGPEAVRRDQALAGVASVRGRDERWEEVPLPMTKEV